MLALEPGRTVSADRAGRGSVGRGAAAERAEDGAALRLAPASRCSTATARESSRAAAATSCELADGERRRRARRAAAGGRARRARRSRCGAASALADVADEPFAAAEIRRLDELRLRAAELAIDADLAAGRHAEVIGELDALVAAHPLREHLHAPADARAVSRRPPVGGARRLPERARRARRADRRRARRRAAAPARGDPRAGPGARPAPRPEAPGRAPRPPPRTARSSGCWSAPPRSSSPASRRSGSSACSSPTVSRASDENAVGRDRPGRRRITDAVPGRPRLRTRVIVAAAGSVWIANEAATAPSRGSIASDRRGGDDPGRRRAGRARVRRRVAVGGRRRRPRGRAGRPGLEQGRAARSRPGNAPRVAGGGGGRAVGRVRRRRQHRAGSSIGGAAASREIPLGAKADRDRGRRRRALGGERGGGHGHPPRPALRRGRRARSTSATGRARSRRARARCGSSTATTGRSRAIDPGTNAVSGSVRVGADPTRRRRRARARCGWRAGRTAPSPASIPAARACSTRLRTGSSPAALAVAGGSVWAAADAPRRRTAAGRCAWSRALSAGRDPARLAASGRGYTTETWHARLAGLRRPRRLPARRGRRRRDARRRARHAPRRRPAPTAAPTSSRCARACATRTAARCGRRTSGPRWSATCSATRAATFPPFFAAIVGAPACMRRPARCDLSRGIEIGSGARGTITIHLDRVRTRSSSTSSRCPSRSSCPPARPRARPQSLAAARHRALPDRRRGTPHRGGVLVRNPHFRPSRRAGRRDSPTGSRSAGVHGGTVDRADREPSSAATADVARPRRTRSTSLRHAEPPQGARSPRAGTGAQHPDADQRLDVPQRPAPAVRRHPRPARGQPRRPTAPSSSSWRAVPSSRARPARSCPTAFPGYEPVLPVHRRPVARPRVDRARHRARAPACRGIRDGRASASSSRCTSYRRAAGRYFTRAAEPARLPRDAAHPAEREARAAYDLRTAGADDRRRLTRPTTSAPSTFIQSLLHAGGGRPTSRTCATARSRT